MSILNKEFNKLLSRSGFIFICRVSGAALVFFTQVMLARWMGAAELGVYVYAFSLAMLLSMVAGLGLPAAALQFIPQYLAQRKTASINGFLHKGRQTILVASLGVSVVAFAMLSFISGSGGDYYHPVLIGIACIPFIAIFRFHDRIAHVFSWFTLGFLPSMTLRPLFFLIALYIVWESTRHLSASIAMMIQFGSIIVVMAGQYLLLRPRLKREINNCQTDCELFVWLRSSFPLLLITVVTQYFIEFTVILIGADLSSDEIAIYNASYRTALIIGFIYNAVCAALVPKIAQMHAEGDVVSMQRYITRATRLTFFLSLFGFLLLLIAGKFLLGMFGEEFIAGYPALLTLAVSQLVLASVGPVVILLNITGYQEKCLYAFASSIILTVVLEALIVPDFGILGAAIVVLLVTVFWALWLHQLVVRHLNIYPSIMSFSKIRSK